MRKILPFLLLVLFAIPVFAADGPNTVEEAFTKAFLANDLQGVLALYAPNATLFPPDAFEAEGTTAIHDSYAGMMNQFTIQAFSLSDAHHETQGDISVGWGEWSLTMVPKAGGDPVTMKGRFTDVSKKINGKWLYIADHASLPLPPPDQAAPAK